MKGFTLIELLLVMGVFAVLSAFAVISLNRPQTQSALDGTAYTLIADLKNEQLKAMTRSSGSFGLQFNAQSYTLLNDNFTVTLDTNLSLSTTFPSSQLVFSRLSGEVSGFVNGSNTITLTNTASSESKTITVNRLGVINLQ